MRRAVAAFAALALAVLLAAGSGGVASLSAAAQAVSLKGRVVLPLADQSGARNVTYEGTFHGGLDLAPLQPFLKVVVLDGMQKVVAESPLGENLDFSFPRLEAARRYYLVLVASRPYTLLEVIPLPVRWTFVLPGPGEKVLREWFSANGFVYNRIVERPGVSWHMRISFPRAGSWYQQLTWRNQDEIFSRDKGAGPSPSLAEPAWGRTGDEAVRELAVESVEVIGATGSHLLLARVRVRNAGAEPALLVRAAVSFTDEASREPLGEFEALVPSLAQGEAKTVTVETTLRARSAFSAPGPVFTTFLEDPGSAVQPRYPERRLRLTVTLASP